MTIDGVYGPATRQAVMALQRDAGLPQTGSVSEATWDAIVERFLSIDRTVLASAGLTPFRSSLSGELTPEEIQESLALHPNQFPGRNLEYGQTD